MDTTKILLIFTMFLLEVASGCFKQSLSTSLKCYICNSLDSPMTCTENMFNSSVHTDDTTSGSRSQTSCVQGYTTNGTGTFYYRDKSSKENNECKPHVCYCNDNLCNSTVSPEVSMATILATTLFCFTYFKKISL